MRCRRQFRHSVVLPVDSGAPQRNSDAMKLLIVAIAALLAGCTHLTLMSRDGSSGGSGEAQGYAGSGTLTINLDGKTYRGSWTSVSGSTQSQTGGFVGTTPFAATTYANGASNGSAILRAPDGSGLRCQFTMTPSTFGATGYGICQADGGKTYDLQIQ